MTTFARVVDGFALDCQEAASADDLAARYHPEWLAKHPFSVVPDGTIHGAISNGDGTFTNPLNNASIHISTAPDPIADLAKKLDVLSTALAQAFPAVAQAMPPDQS